MKNRLMFCRLTTGASAVIAGKLYLVYQVFAKRIVKLPEHNFHKAFAYSPSHRGDVNVVVSRCLLTPAYSPASGCQPITARICPHASICHPPAENHSFPSLVFFASCSLLLCICAGPFFFFAFIFTFSLARVCKCCL